MSEVPTMSGGSHAALEDAGVGFDPTSQHMDLSKEEKRRTTALLMAIQAYQGLIIKDAEMLREVRIQARENPDAPKIQPATMDAMVAAAIQFDDFIAGKPSSANPKVSNECPLQPSAERP
jgi:hypothetical protein